MKYKEGDVLTVNHYEKVILAVCGRAYLISSLDDVDVCGGWFTEHTLDDAGWTLKTDPPKLTTLSMEDVAKLAGVDVASLRIKKEES